MQKSSQRFPYLFFCKCKCKFLHFHSAEKVLFSGLDEVFTSNVLKEVIQQCTTLLLKTFDRVFAFTGNSLPSLNPTCRLNTDYSPASLRVTRQQLHPWTALCSPLNVIILLLEAGLNPDIREGHSGVWTITQKQATEAPEAFFYFRKHCHCAGGPFVRLLFEHSGRQAGRGHLYTVCGLAPELQNIHHHPNYFQMSHFSRKYWTPSIFSEVLPIKSWNPRSSTADDYLVWTSLVFDKLPFAESCRTLLGAVSVILQVLILFLPLSCSGGMFWRSVILG